jgi:hypothetical protein
MKRYFAFLFCFITVFATAQKSSSLLTVYLNDAQTGENVKDATVTLEGYEIPAIKGKYDKKGKFYYFDAIPKGYNTVMAYHKKYNEKGFQNTEALPNEISLKLYTPYRVRIPQDSLNYYKEDHSKIVVAFDDDFFVKNFKCNAAASESMEYCYAKEYLRINYPEITLNKRIDFGMYSFYSVVIEKKDKSSFKRFNDLIIKRLSEDKNILICYGLLLKTEINMPKNKIKKEFFSQNGTPNYIPRYINHDTVSRSSGRIQNAIDQNGAIIMNNKPKPDVRFFNYTVKFDKNHFKDNIYTLSDKALKALYKTDDGNYKKNGFYDFQNYQQNDTLKFWQKQLYPESKTVPYIAVSNVLNYSYADYSDVGEKIFLHYENFNNSPDLDAVYKNREGIIAKKAKTNTAFVIYKLKNTTASPFGMKDMIEYYNSNGKKIYQKIETNIQR